MRGTPLAVLHMTRALAALGHEVDLLTFPRGQAAPVEGVRHLRSLRLPVGRVKAGPSLAKMALDVPFVLEAAWRLRFGGYDVVHAVEEAAHLVAPFARLLRRARSSWTWTRRSPTSSATRASRPAGRSSGWPRPSSATRCGTPPPR